MRKALREVRGVRYVEVLGIKEAGTVDFLVESERNQDVRADVFRAMVSLQRPVLMFRPMDVTLEDIFLQLTSQDKEDN